jgi:hypothetical protein
MSRIQIGGRSITTTEIQELLATDHPMVEQFRFESSRGYRGESLGFTLHIIPRRGVRYAQQRDARGRRVEPVWRTLTGQETIGQGNRAIWLEGDELVAENCTFFPNQEFNDLGIGSALYASMERFYRHLGIRRVTLLAVDVGVYVWARQGFAFESRARVSGLVKELERFVHEHGGSATLDPARFQESWDLANYDLAGLTIDGYRAGKAFMLTRAPPWHGTKYLDDARHNEVAEASRRETFARLPDKIEGAPATLAVC